MDPRLAGEMIRVSEPQPRIVCKKKEGEGGGGVGSYVVVYDVDFSFFAKLIEENASLCLRIRAVLDHL